MSHDDDTTEQPNADVVGRDAVPAGHVVTGWTMQPDRGMGGHFGNRHPAPLTRPVTPVEQAVEDAFTDLLERARQAPSVSECHAGIENALALAARHGLMLTPPSPPPPGGGVSGHLARMDAARIAITAALVLGVLAVICWALYDRDVAAASQFAAPISGLAGICLGWLFTSTAGSHVASRSVEPPTQRSD